MSAQRLAVWNGEKEKTSGGLRKADLTKNRHGRIVSKRKSEVARKLNNLGNFLAGKGKKQEAKPEPKAEAGKAQAEAEAGKGPGKAPGKARVAAGKNHCGQGGACAAAAKQEDLGVPHKRGREQHHPEIGAPKKEAQARGLL